MAFLNNQALADVRSTDAEIKCLYCSKSMQYIFLNMRKNPTQMKFVSTPIEKYRIIFIITLSLRRMLKHD